MPRENPNSSTRGLDGILTGVAKPSGDLLDFSLDPDKNRKDLFAPVERKHWANAGDSRCDMAKVLKLTHRGGVHYISLWKKSMYGRLMAEIKEDSEMITHFATEISQLIKAMWGSNLAQGDWAIVTTPSRRHKTRHFASLVSQKIADTLEIPYYASCATTDSRRRIGVTFQANNIPDERNIIVFDDIVTTGSTFSNMKALLDEHCKNSFFIAGINNNA